MRWVLIVALLLMPVGVTAATLTWEAPTYSDNTVIPPDLAARIVYTPFIADSATGPWVAGNKTAPGALSATLPDPAPGATRWYTVDATLGNQTSAKAVPASKTILKGIGTPSIISIQY